MHLSQFVHNVIENKMMLKDLSESFSKTKTEI